VEKRFEAHKAGLGAKYTRANKPVKIVYTACFDTKIEAQRNERFIKKISRQKKCLFIFYKLSVYNCYVKTKKEGG